ncbi:MAG: cysteine desulfurase [Planctomycetaceae bacterium]|nr:cysteine desulfurase [Planctomycetaceae bacterium]
MIYLDYNATTPLADEVVAAMEPYLRQAFGNASSLHWAGRPARAAIDTAREQVAALLGCQPSEVVFTSGGTEANNYALKGLFFARLAKQLPTHIITSQIEHPAILEPCRFLESLGAEVTRLPVDRFGLVDPAAVRAALRPHTALVSIMQANNEVGTIQPLAEIAAIAHEHGALVHTDAAQSVGKISTRVAELGVDLLTIAGHKLYAPKGVGAIYVRAGITLAPFLHGAGHEQGRRAGTENILEIVGLGAACELAQSWLDRPELRELRDYFWNALQTALGERVSLNGHPQRRLPNTLNCNFHGQIGSELLAKLPQLAASTGSACHAGSHHLSPVLAAMGVSPTIGLGAIRFSLGRHTTRDVIDQTLEMLAACVR